MLDQTAKVFREEGLPIYAMTQAKPFEMRYTLLDAQCFDEFPTWKTAMFSPVETRKQMYEEAEAALIADVPIIPLTYPSQIWLIKPHVKGLIPRNLIGYPSYRYASVEAM